MPPRFFDVEFRDDAIFDHGGVAAGPQAEPEAGAVHDEVHRAAEVATAVREHHDLVAHVLRLAPRVHDPRVVDGDTGDGVDAFGLQLIGLRHEAGQVHAGAAGRERSGHRKQHDLALAQHVAGAHRYGRALGAHRLQLDIRNLIADRENHDASCSECSGDPRGSRRDDFRARRTFGRPRRSAHERAETRERRRRRQPIPPPKAASHCGNCSRHGWARSRRAEPTVA